MRSQFIECAPGLIRCDDLHEFDLLELMLSNHAACVATITSRFTAKARRVCNVSNRQLVMVEDAITKQVRHRDFGGWHQIETVRTRNPELVVGEFRQLSRSVHRFAVDEIRNVDLFVAVFGYMQVEHELCQRTLKACQGTTNDDETRAAEARSGGEIE